MPVTSGAIRYKTKDIDALVAQLDTLKISSHLAFDSDSDSDVEPARPFQPFRFFDLPSELRTYVLELLLVKDKTVDLDPSNTRTLIPCLRLFFVSRRMHAEASHVFYSQNTFRIFAINGRFFQTKKQLLTRLPVRYITHMRSLELRLGTGFNKPPKSWVVDSKLKLDAAVNVRLLKVFVEFDPASHPSFEGYKKVTGGSAGQFFTTFSVGLFGCLMGELQQLQRVQFDGNPSISRDSPLMKALIEQTRLGGKEVTWGPERGWDKIVDEELGSMLQIMGIGL